jgi:type I restriction enzyme, S subunit
MNWKRYAEDPDELCYVREFYDLRKSSRFDPEHFQPRFRRLQKHLKKVGAKSISDFCQKPSRGIQPDFVPGGKIAVIDSKAVRPWGVRLSKDEQTDSSFYNRVNSSKARVRRGDVLLNSTGRGTIGRSTWYDSDDKAICDNHVAVLRPDNGVCLAPYLSLFLNSPAGSAQTEMYQTGSSGQLEIYPQQIQQFLVFLPKKANGAIDIEWQRGLSDRLIGAAGKRKEAERMIAEGQLMLEKLLAKAGVSPSDKAI